MNRPLAWVGIAFLMGEGWAASGCTVFSGILIVAIELMITGRYRQKLHGSWLLYILPVFFMSGFVVFSMDTHKMLPDNEIEEMKSVCFSGEVTDWSESEKTVCCMIKKADVIWKEQHYQMGLVMYVDKKNLVPKFGDYVCGKGQLSDFQNATNPGQWDASVYYYAKGMQCVVWPKQYEITASSNGYMKKLFVFGRLWIEQIMRDLPEREGGIVCAILLGEKQWVSPESQTLYQYSGVFHMLSVSGMHISLIGMTIYELLRKLRLGFCVSSTIAAFTVMSYAVMIGMPLSAQRALIMFLVRMGAVYFGKSYDMLSAAGLSILVILWMQPQAVLTPGFQFSYLAIAGMGVLWPYIQKVLRIKEWRGMYRTAAYAAGASLSVNLLTMPLMAWYYGFLPIAGIVLNLIVVPMMSLCIGIGGTAALISFVSDHASVFVCGSLHYLLSIIEWFCMKGTSIPGMIYWTGRPYIWMMIVYYGCIIGALLLGTVGALYVNWPCFASIMILFMLLPLRKAECFVAFLDVGQGDAALMRTTEGKIWLIDAGSTSQKSIGTYVIEPALAYYGETMIDYACISHGDEDHISGVRELIEHNKIHTLLIPVSAAGDEKCMELVSMAEEKHLNVEWIEKGWQWRGKNCGVRCIYPEKTMQIVDKNDQSMVLRLETPIGNILMTGDASQNAEKNLMDEDITDIALLKAGHHGSASSSSQDFIFRTGAHTVVISCAKNNKYGHPSPETIARFQKAGMQILLTKEQGAVIFRFWKWKSILT